MRNPYGSTNLISSVSFQHAVWLVLLTLGLVLGWTTAIKAQPMIQAEATEELGAEEQTLESPSATEATQEEENLQKAQEQLQQSEPKLQQSEQELLEESDEQPEETLEEEESSDVEDNSTGAPITPDQDNPDQFEIKVPL